MRPFASQTVLGALALSPNTNAPFFAGGMLAKRLHRSRDILISESVLCVRSRVSPTRPSPTSRSDFFEFFLYEAVLKKEKPLSLI